jgi:SHS2 domain-containing protein
VKTPRFRTLAHTADLRVAVWGGDEEELICNAVAAAVATALGRAPNLAPRAWAPLRPWPAGLPARLVRAVNEALFHLYTRKQIAVGFALAGQGARLALAPLPQAWCPDIEIKAATYHDLRPRRRAGRLAALLTLDV